MTKHNWAYESVTCPVCGAKPNEPCTSEGKPVLFFHAGRVDRAQHDRLPNSAWRFTTQK